jgi:hypothetical protein
LCLGMCFRSSFKLALKQIAVGSFPDDEDLEI